jgi:nucleotide-binding universal stress UspA family protein
MLPWRRPPQVGHVKEMVGMRSRSPAIVVGVDMSDSSRDAAEWAAGLAAVWSVPLHLLHVAAGAPEGSPASPHPAWLTELCAGAIRAGADPQDSEVVPGNTVEMLADRAGDARMLVLGSYGVGAESGMLAGSVALGLLERVRCPVVVVRGSAPRIPPARGGPIVVGVDGTPAGQAALEFAADLAVSLGCRLTAVHTWSDVTVDHDGAMHRLDDNEAVLAEQAGARVDEALAPITAAHPELPVQREVVNDTPLRALLGRAAGARLLVVGHRRHRPGSGMALGSTSQGLVEFAPCPVAVIKPTTELRPQPASARSGDA